jgi:DNA-binding transcriptional LysR family regulator
VPKALAAFRAAHPSVSLSVLEGTSAAMLGRLQNREIDVAVISAYPHQTPDTGHLALHHLLDDPLMVALPAGHRLAWLGRKALRLAELAGESCIEGFPDSSQTLTDACLRAGFRPQINFTVRQWTAKQGFVSAGLGLALVPFLAAGAIRAQHCAPPAPSRRRACPWRLRRHLARDHSAAAGHDLPGLPRCRCAGTVDRTLA